MIHDQDKLTQSSISRSTKMEARRLAIDQAGQDWHPLVLELVLEYVDTESLPACRLVNHAWNEVASRLLNKFGRLVHLDGGNSRAYLKLLQANSGLKSGHRTRAPNITGLNLSILVCCSHSVLNTAIEIASFAGFTSLTCIIDRKGFEDTYMTLIKLSSSTLRGISFKVYARTPKPVKDNLRLSWNKFRAKLVGETPKSSPYGIFKLPNLKTLDIQYTPEDYEFPATAVPRIILEVAMAAAVTNLESIRVDGSSQSAVIPSILSELHKLDAPKLQGLWELNLRLARPEHLKILEDVSFSRLRTLIIVNGHYSNLSPILAHFARNNCPALQTLHIFDKSPFPMMYTDGDGDDDSGNGNTQVTHETVTHFGFYSDERRAFPPEDSVSHAAAILSNMRPFPNLEKVSLNFVCCDALAAFFSRATAAAAHSVGAEFRKRKWPHVTCVSISCADLYTITRGRIWTEGDDDDEGRDDLLRNLRRSFEAMFPNLKRVELAMGEYIGFKPTHYKKLIEKFVWAMVMNSVWHFEIVGDKKWLTTALHLKRECEHEHDHLLQGHGPFVLSERVTFRCVQGPNKNHLFMF